jgi:hypothetical protein
MANRGVKSSITGLIITIAVLTFLCLFQLSFAVKTRTPWPSTQHKISTTTKIPATANAGPRGKLAGFSLSNSGKQAVVFRLKQNAKGYKTFPAALVDFRTKTERPINLDLSPGAQWSPDDRYICYNLSYDKALKSGPQELRLGLMAIPEIKDLGVIKCPAHLQMSMFPQWLTNN